MKNQKTLTPIANKPFYFRDNEGYKYYINKGVKIKSKKPLL